MITHLMISNSVAPLGGCEPVLLKKCLVAQYSTSCTQDRNAGIVSFVVSFPMFPSCHHMLAAAEVTASCFHWVHFVRRCLTLQPVTGTESNHTNRKVKRVKSQTSLWHFNLSLLPYARVAIKLSVVILLLAILQHQDISHWSVAVIYLEQVIQHCVNAGFLIGNFSSPPPLFGLVGILIGCLCVSPCFTPCP